MPANGVLIHPRGFATRAPRPRSSPAASASSSIQEGSQQRVGAGPEGGGRGASSTQEGSQHVAPGGEHRGFGGSSSTQEGSQHIPEVRGELLALLSSSTQEGSQHADEEGGQGAGQVVIHPVGFATGWRTGCCPRRRPSSSTQEGSKHGGQHPARRTGGGPHPPKRVRNSPGWSGPWTASTSSSTQEGSQRSGKPGRERQLVESSSAQEGSQRGHLHLGPRAATCRHPPKRVRNPGTSGMEPISV
jgi:hypothetical protein